METVRLRINWRRGLFRVWAVAVAAWAVCAGAFVYAYWPRADRCVDFSSCNHFPGLVVVPDGANHLKVVRRWETSFELQRVPAGYYAAIQIARELEEDARLREEVYEAMSAASEVRRKEAITELLVVAAVGLLVPPVAVWLLGAFGFMAAPYVSRFASRLFSSTVGRLARWLSAGFRPV